MLATTNRTPYDVLSKADRTWRKTHGHALFDRSYLSQTPSVCANQQIGLATVTHLANHINTSLTKIQPSRSGEVCDSSSQSGMLCHWRCLIGTFMKARWGILPTNMVKTIWLMNCSMWKVMFLDVPWTKIAAELVR